MSKQEFIDKISASTLSETRKQEVLILLAGELTPEVKQQIRDIIQSDIDAETADILSADDAEVITAHAQMESGLASVQQALDADLAFVETEMAELEVLVKDVEVAADAAKADALKQGILS